MQKLTPKNTIFGKIRHEKLIKFWVFLNRSFN